MLLQEPYVFIADRVPIHVEMLEKPIAPSTIKQRVQDFFNIKVRTLCEYCAVPTEAPSIACTDF